MNVLTVLQTCYKLLHCKHAPGQYYVINMLSRVIILQTSFCKLPCYEQVPLHYYTYDEHILARYYTCVDARACFHGTAYILGYE